MIIDMLTAWLLANTSHPTVRADGYTMVDTAITIEYSYEKASSNGRKHLTLRISLLELLTFVWSQTK